MYLCVGSGIVEVELSGNYSLKKFHQVARPRCFSCVSGVVAGASGTIAGCFLLCKLFFITNAQSCGRCNDFNIFLAGLVVRS